MNKLPLYKSFWDCENLVWFQCVILKATAVLPLGSRVSERLYLLN